MSKKILLTGANGYIGSHVVDEFIQQEFEVIAVDIDNRNINSDAQFVSFNVFDPTKNICDLVGVPDMCLHMAYLDGFNHSAYSHMEYVNKHFEFINP